MRPVSELTASELQAWASLAAEALEPNPFFHPANVVAACAEPGLADGVVVASVSEGDRMLALAPLRREADWGRHHLDAMTTRVAEAPIGLGTPLLSPHASIGAVEALLGAVHEHGGAGFLVLEWSGAGGAVEALVRHCAMRLRMPVLVAEAWRRPALYRNGLRPRLAPKRERALARWVRATEREFGAPAKLARVTGDEGWAARFLEMEAGGWKGRQHPGAGALALEEPTARWFDRAATAMARSGWAQPFSLFAADRELAMMFVTTVPGRAAFATRTTYDERYRSLAPGLQLLVQLEAHFAADPSAGGFCDSCTGGEATYFREVFPEMRQVHNLVVATGGPFARLALLGAPVGRWAVSSGRRYLSRARSAGVGALPQGGAGDVGRPGQRPTRRIAQ